MNISTVNELIAYLESAGELSIKERKYLELAKAYADREAESVALALTFDKCREITNCPVGVDLQDHLRQLAAENVALASENKMAVDAVTVFSNVTHDITEIICDELGNDRVAEILAAYNDLGNMPATDAYLAGIKADGVEMFVEKCREKAKQAVSSDIRDNWWLAGEHADDFAKQLREGAK